MSDRLIHLITAIEEGLESLFGASSLTVFDPPLEKGRVMSRKALSYLDRSGIQESLESFAELFEPLETQVKVSSPEVGNRVLVLQTFIEESSEEAHRITLMPATFSSLTLGKEYEVQISSTAFFQDSGGRATPSIYLTKEGRMELDSLSLYDSSEFYPIRSRSELGELFSSFLTVGQFQITEEVVDSLVEAIDKVSPELKPHFGPDGAWSLSLIPDPFPFYGLRLRLGISLDFRRFP